MVLGISNNMFAPGGINATDLPTWYWVTTGLSAAAGTLLMVIIFTFQAFQYFNLEERENPTINLEPNELE